MNEKEEACANCFTDLSNGQEYDYGMDLLLCKNCHGHYLDGKLTSKRLCFIKHQVELLGVTEQLQAEIDKLKDGLIAEKELHSFDISNLCKEIDRLRKELAKYKAAYEVLKEANGFYKKEMNYSMDDYQGISGEMRSRVVLYGDSDERNDIYSYAGKRARESAKKAKEIINGVD